MPASTVTPARRGARASGTKLAGACVPGEREHGPTNQTHREREEARVNPHQGTAWPKGARAGRAMAGGKRTSPTHKETATEATESLGNGAGSKRRRWGSYHGVRHGRR